MRHELLAPAGSYDICEAVLAAGADAVYLGGEKYSARAFAPNFSERDILRALDLAHLHGKRIYLAVNTLLKNREMGRDLYQYIKPYYEEGLDAIIVQDFGVFQFVKEYFPKLPVHISTQMSAANSWGVEFLRDMGAKRVVTARELSLGEIRNIRDRTGIEIECFVHGALCYCYSGQCLMSSIIGGRSGNRGRCAQPCRLPYHVVDQSGNALDDGACYPLSLKDLCTIDIIPALCEAGAYALKIEGRMKSLEYAAGVTGLYRKYLDIYESGDERYEVSKKDRDVLMALGNRSGFTKGYYEMRSGRSMLTLTDSSHSSSEAAEAYEPCDLPKIPITGKVSLTCGMPAKLTVCDSVSVKGDTVQEALNRPLGADEVREHIQKTGDTPFIFSKLDVEMGGECFMPVSRLNELRRRALDQLSDHLLSEYRRPDEGEPRFPGEQPYVRQSNAASALDVTVCTADQLDVAAGCDFVDCISLEPDAASAFFSEDKTFLSGEYIGFVDKCRERIAGAGKKTGFCFPYVFRKDTSDLFGQDDWMDVISRFDILWARSFDSLEFCLSAPAISRVQIRTDFGLYVFSEYARRSFMSLGIGGYTASSELNAGELSHMQNSKAEFAVYGYTPVMVSAQCIYKNYGGCKKGEDSLICICDRYGSRFPVKKDCMDCYNVIYNSRPLNILSRADEILPLGFGSHRIVFVTENGDEAASVLEDYRRGFLDGEPVAAPADKPGYTNGHFRRGVE